MECAPGGCTHNAHIDCTDNNCAGCGWNPVVAKARAIAVRRRREAARRANNAATRCGSCAICPYDTAQPEEEIKLFRFKSAVKVSYNRQGYIYFVSRLFRELGEEEQRAILDLCREAGGEYQQALFEYVTMGASVTELTMKHFISRGTLFRIIRRYYESFPQKL